MTYTCTCYTQYLFSNDYEPKKGCTRLLIYQSEIPANTC